MTFLKMRQLILFMLSLFSKLTTLSERFKTKMHKENLAQAGDLVSKSDFYAKKRGCPKGQPLFILAKLSLFFHDFSRNRFRTCI